MHLATQTLSANGDSPWIIPGPMLLATTLGLLLRFTSNANLTANVEYTYSDPLQTERAVTLARAGTVLTVTDPAHKLNAGDAVQLSNPLLDPNNTWGADTLWKLWGTAYDIATIVDQNNYTLTVANAGAAAATGFIRSFALLTHPVLKAITGAPPARIDSSLGFPVGAIRLNVTGYVAGSAELTVQQAKGY
jgi:hypothetical protein